MHTVQCTRMGGIWYGSICDPCAIAAKPPSTMREWLRISEMLFTANSVDCDSFTLTNRANLVFIVVFWLLLLFTFECGSRERARTNKPYDAISPPIAICRTSILISSTSPSSSSCFCFDYFCYDCALAAIVPSPSWPAGRRRRHIVCLTLFSPGDQTILAHYYCHGFGFISFDFFHLDSCRGPHRPNGVGCLWRQCSVRSLRQPKPRRNAKTASTKRNKRQKQFQFSGDSDQEKVKSTPSCSTWCI